jgi:hypothetical protein
MLGFTMLLHAFDPITGLSCPSTMDSSINPKLRHAFDPITGLLGVSFSQHSSALQCRNTPLKVLTLTPTCTESDADSTHFT